MPCLCHIDGLGAKEAAPAAALARLGWDHAFGVVLFIYLFIVCSLRSLGTVTTYGWDLSVKLKGVGITCSILLPWFLSVKHPGVAFGLVSFLYSGTYHYHHQVRHAKAAITSE
ncbi:hypothetical protein B0T22DRAFT_13062 [Podospora appendiculata]|uniref:Uncharacterized protein n=1 Tax=Podospora appendiculata TaxID=314037 RepID=A0AAE0XFA2_9PEZI|nr:hypothetical protein B0T22DRAFT_13062 [Podospora appendiculata]